MVRGGRLGGARIAFVSWVTLWIAACSVGGLYSWHYFQTAGAALLRSGPANGLHIYASHPELQFGPLTMVVCALIALAPAALSAAVGVATMLVLGLGTMWALVDIGQYLHPDYRWARLGLTFGALLVPGWMVLTVHFGHLDDALALSLIALAASRACRGGWVGAGLLLSAAAAAKPWALPMAVVLLAAPHRLQRHRALAAYLVVQVCAWLPFVAADHRTVQLGAFTIRLAPDSVLHLLGVTSTYMPAWDRPAQFALGAIAAWWFIRRGRWLAAPFAVLAVRMLLDPQTYGYYSSGLMVTAVLVDLGRRTPYPIVSLTTVTWMAASAPLSAIASPATCALIRLLALAAALAVSMRSPLDPPADPDPAHSTVAEPSYERV